MRDVYLDTNILLAFYGLSSEELEELRKLVALVRQRELRLHLPQHTEDEFRRNHASKVAEALKKLRDQKLSLQVPQLAREYPAFDELRKHQRALETAHAQLVQDVTADVEAAELRADKVVAELFSLAHKSATTPELLNAARTRNELGHPPGKHDSLGDALNWETLLQVVPEGKDLVFVTDDGDYASPIRAEDFHPYLLAEWRTMKGTYILFYRRLSTFLASHYPAISLSSDTHKDELIRELASSISFAQTHLVISRLKNYVDFTVAQRNDILRAVAANTQVAWIVLDEDVHGFVQSVVKGYERSLDESVLAEYVSVLKAALLERQKRGEEAAQMFGAGDDDLPF